jgi:hypothetical protein
MTQQVVCGEKCIPVAWLCNGEQECPDGTDEQCGKCFSRLCHAYGPDCQVQIEIENLKCSKIQRFEHQHDATSGKFYS